MPAAGTRFGVGLTSGQAAEGLAAHTEAELLLCQQMRDFMERRAKVEQEYAAALAKINKSISMSKTVPNPPYQWPLHEVCVWGRAAACPGCTG